ncbi:cytokine receptor [Anabrus simplex]|uniref:cytokine receptor n=1 Tax=Anabrus simplex TaxID=316456 RepID=UPI0035A34451
MKTSARKMSPLMRKSRKHSSGCLVSSLILMLFTLPCNAIDNKFDCGTGPNDLGVILPRDIVLEEGRPLEMFCHLNLDHRHAKGHNASDLVFFRDKNVVNKAFIEVLNATTIRLFEKNPPASMAMYFCLLQTNKSGSEISSKTGVCLTQVVIGYKPKEVLNFTCISHNWENLTCKWTKPENPVDTKYKLHFRLPGRAGARMVYNCSNSSEEIKLQRKLKPNEGLCFWSLSTAPMYRLPYEYYYFQMIGENKLGKVEFPWMKFHHYSHVIPSQPQHLVYLNTTFNSILLAWSVPSNVVHFSPGLTQRVDYQSTWDRNEWHTVDASQLIIKNQSNHTFNLTGLKYANTHYDIRVYMKSAVAVGDDKWSKPATLTVKTNPTLPGASPRTDIGSFEEVEVNGVTSRDIYVYWQQIPKHLQNADGFQYKVISVKEMDPSEPIERHPHLQPVEMTNAYAKFKGLSFNSYNFTIIAVNSEGNSEPAYVYVPSKMNIPPEPISVTKIAFSPRLYELSWKPSDKEDLIENYTIFWCNNVRDRPYQCPGYLDWIHVPKNETVKNITVPDDEIYQFAVSANTKYGSSGMVWASCTVIHNKTIGKMRSVWINRVGSDFIEVGWKFECSDRIGRIENFVIMFCPISMAENNSTCKEPEQDLPTSPTQIHNNITGLKPYTTYMVSVAIVTHSRIRQQSDRLYGTTLESAPSPPRNVTISNVTNSAMIVSWFPPEFRNGVITLYKVCYGEPYTCIRMDSNNTLLDSQFSYKVENMTSYKDYKVSIEACTIKCSEPSQPVWAHTLIGIPGIMDRPKIKFVNASQIEVAWKPPPVPGGMLNFYQVAIHLTDGDKNRSSYYNSTSNSTQIPVCDSDGILHEKYGIMVRAVNIDLQNKIYFGPWSESTEYSCYSPGLSKPLRTAVVVFGVLLITGLAILLLYAGKRIWLCCKEMQDLVPKLPPGLAPTCEKEKDSDFHIDVAWPSHDLQVTGKPLLDENEVQHAHSHGGDSSGCSSGHESVSSSLTSGTQISSDSGTEADQRPPSPDGVFLNTPWDRTSLRQRNVNALRPVGDSYIIMGKGSESIARSTPNLTDTDGVSVGATGPAYSCLGTWSLMGYGMPSSEDVENSSGREEIRYCRVGLDADAVAPSQQIEQQAHLIPSKGYVVLSNLSASTPQLLPQSDTFSQMESSPQPHRYVTHQMQQCSPGSTDLKVGQTGKGYVMAGEHTKTTSSPDVDEFEDEDHGFLDLESLDKEDDSYSRFGLQPIQSSEAKPSSGYVTLGNNSHPSDIVTASVGSGPRIGGTSSGYVPHRHFEKRDVPSLDATLSVDHVDEPYSNMVSMSAGDTSISSSKVNV